MAEINREFFDEWTPDLAWWLGVMFGDGHVGKHENIRKTTTPSGKNKAGTINRYYLVEVVGEDSDVISKWKGLLVKGDCYHEPVKGSKCDEVRLQSKEAWEIISERWHLPNKKSHSLIWPSDLPEHLERFFIRGLMDSDGCLGVERRKDNPNKKGFDKPHLVYTSACRPFAESVMKKIASRFDIDEVAITEGRKKLKGKEYKWYSFRFHNYAANMIADWIYQGRPDLSSDRKRAMVEVEFKQALVRDRCRNGCVTVADSNGLCRSCNMKRLRPLKECECGKTMGFDASKCRDCNREDRRSDGLEERRPTGTCSYCEEKPAYRRGLCDACYGKDVKRRHYDKGFLDAKVLSKDDYLHDTYSAYRRGYKEGLVAAGLGPAVPDCRLCEKPATHDGMCRSHYRKELKRQQKNTGVEDARSGGEPRLPKNTSYMSGYKEGLPKPLCSQCGKQPIATTEYPIPDSGLCSSCKRNASRLAHYYRSST